MTKAKHSKKRQKLSDLSSIKDDTIPNNLALQDDSLKGSEELILEDLLFGNKKLSTLQPSLVDETWAESERSNSPINLLDSEVR